MICCSLNTKNHQCTVSCMVITWFGYLTYLQGFINVQ
uniref:Uncharacterized protein n=1 Tax=Anguilla anguilla TaxID=7936 RepID=A0A0E9RQ66_ANGAN